MSNAEYYRLIASWCINHAERLDKQIKLARRAYSSVPMVEPTQQYADLMEKHSAEFKRAAFALNIKADREQPKP